MYVWDDMLKFRLPDRQLEEFLRAVHYLTSSDSNLEDFGEEDDFKKYERRMRVVAEVLLVNAYKNRPEYILAATSRDRALAAMKGGTQSAMDDILKLWEDVANKVPVVQRLLLGWNKV